MGLFQVDIVCHGDVSSCYCMLWNCFRLVSCVMGLFHVVIVYCGTVSGWCRVTWGCFTLLLYVMELFQVGIMRHRDVSGCYCMLWNCFRLVSCVMGLFYDITMCQASSIIWQDSRIGKTAVCRTSRIYGCLPNLTFSKQF